ncbi:MAG TPA: hypothetical protein VH988_21805 [Thermoanaerobaculia bacterium]|nr:hypothetical protein [Thermoanaerobaculia bacterium]
MAAVAERRDEPTTSHEDFVAELRRRDGSEFEIAPVRSQASPLDIEGVDLGLSAEEIVSALRETRVRAGR